MVARLSKNCNNNIPSLSQKTLATTLASEVVRVKFYLPHPPYSPRLAPSDFRILVPLKDALQRRRFWEDVELKHSVRQERRRFSMEFYPTGIQCLTHQGKKCVDDEGDFVEK